MPTQFKKNQIINYRDVRGIKHRVQVIAIEVDHVSNKGHRLNIRYIDETSPQYLAETWVSGEECSEI